MVAATALVGFACTSTGPDAVTVTDTTAEGQVALTVYSGVISDAVGPDGSIPFEGRFSIVAASDIEDWWAATIPDESVREGAVRDVMIALDTEAEAVVFATDEAWLATGPGREVRTGDDGLALVGIEPGSYLLCALTNGGTSEDGREVLPRVEVCAFLDVQGDTTWTVLSLDHDYEIPVWRIEARPTE